MQEWFSTHWFTYKTLVNFEWYHPIYLYFIPAVPFLYILRGWFRSGRGQRLNVAFLTSDLQSSWTSYLRFIPAIFLSLSIALVLVSLARPQKINTQTERSSEGIDIMLAMDISASMDSKDIPPNRLAVAKKVAKDFIKGRFQDRIGMVIFAGEPFSLCPLTTDYQMLFEYIDDINSNLIKTSGTAIGNALGMCINRMRETSSKTKVAILLSDGDNTAGNLDPVTSAQLAKAFGIKVYTIAVGSNSNPEEAVDEGTLRAIAQTSEGQFFRATDAKSLSSIFKQINRLEKVRIKSSQYKDIQDFYHTYLRWSIVFLLLAFLTKTSFMGNILED
ncbi:Ca-activated chloride channel family protein [Pseudarcicella hirudinis]|uniref:Ca-activated chloride channel family protein n=2 Tax=Pseudarcicella hirudinis TaxID=1079859 RepID=A0A1I5Q5X5_9BACT|nr:VWA domain-containing protein [Pseudarcicella hirudinis]SFP41764.1 Ca-activated chloride channel family protein [Pseudarcicella hirudinis]